MRVYIAASMMAVAMVLGSCDDDEDSFVWASKPHAVSPEGWCVAYEQEDTSPSPTGSSAVWLNIKNTYWRQCSHLAIQFRRTSVPLEMHWMDSTTLEIRYQKDVPVYWPCDVSENIAECAGRKIRIVFVKT